MYLVITRETQSNCMNNKCMLLSIWIYRQQGIEKAEGTRVSGMIEEYIQNLLWQQAIICDKGLSGRSSYENLESHLVKSFNPNRKEIRVPEYRREIKDPNTTQMATWARKTHIHVSKKFAMSRLDFGQGVEKGDSYRKSNLIPTCDAPDLTVH